jgi:hypothetical protein
MDVSDVNKVVKDRFCRSSRYSYRGRGGGTRSPSPHPDTGVVLLQITSRIPFSETREILLTVRGAVSFCCRGQLATTRFWIGRCTMRKHDFVADGFLAVTAASLVLLCSGLLAIAFS